LFTAETYSALLLYLGVPPLLQTGSPILGCLLQNWFNETFKCTVALNRCAIARGIPFCGIIFLEIIIGKDVYFMSRHYEKMKLEMELRGYSPHTQKHYLSHVRLLERYSGKPPDQISPDEIKQYLYYRIKKGISYSNIDTYTFR
jgi:hypothetical protein